MPDTVSFENQPLRGFNIRNLIVTIASTITIVVSILSTYYQSKQDRFEDKSEILGMIKDIKNDQAMQNKLSDLRIQTIETQINVLKQQIEELKQNKKK